MDFNIFQRNKSQFSFVHFSRKSCGFSLTEIIIVFGIILVLATMLVPTMDKVLNRSKAAACLANITQLGRMTFAYAQDYRMNFPILWLDPGKTYSFAHPSGRPGRGGPQGSYSLSWYRALGENGYAQNENDYSWAFSPSDKLSPNEKRGWAEQNQPYGINIDYEYTPFNIIKHQGPSVPFYATASRGNSDRSGYWFQHKRHRSDNSNKLWARHSGICNVWFTDGHAEAISENSLFERLPDVLFYRSYSKKNISQ